MKRPPKKERQPLLVRRIVTGWAGKTGAMPAQTVTQVESIFDDLVRAAKRCSHPDEMVKELGLVVLRRAAEIIAERDGQVVDHVLNAKRPRTRKAARAAVVLDMAKYRGAKPDKTRKDYVHNAERRLVLKVRQSDGGDEYTFDLDAFAGEEFDTVGGEYIVHQLNAMWADAGRIVAAATTAEKSD